MANNSELPESINENKHPAPEIRKYTIDTKIIFEFLMKSLIGLFLELIMIKSNIPDK